MLPETTPAQRSGQIRVLAPFRRRLKRAFAQRHVLIHNGGIVDERFLEQVPDSPLQLHQRLVIRRADAETALQDLDEFVRALAAA